MRTAKTKKELLAEIDNLRAERNEAVMRVNSTVQACRELAASCHGIVAAAVKQYGTDGALILRNVDIRDRTETKKLEDGSYEIRVKE